MLCVLSQMLLTEKIYVLIKKFHIVPHNSVLISIYIVG